MQITQFWDWDAGLGLQRGVTPTPCVSLMASTFPLHVCLVSTTWWWNIYPWVLGMGCCIVLSQPNQCGLLLLLSLSVVFKGRGLSRAEQLLLVSPALQGWVVELGCSRNGSKIPQGISVRRAEPWSRRAAQDGAKRSGSKSKQTLLESLPCHLVTV